MSATKKDINRITSQLKKLDTPFVIVFKLDSGAGTEFYGSIDEIKGLLLLANWAFVGELLKKETE